MSNVFITTKYSLCIAEKYLNPLSFPNVRKNEIFRRLKYDEQNKTSTCRINLTSFSIKRFSSNELWTLPGYSKTLNEKK